MVEPLVAATLGPCRQALADAALGADQVDEVVLVGGSTRMPLVQRRGAERFGPPAHSPLNPDEGGALGAAGPGPSPARGLTPTPLPPAPPPSPPPSTPGRRRGG